MKADTSKDFQNFRIATTLAGLNKGYFFLRKIAPPATATFKGFSQTVPQSEGGLAQHGFKNVTLSWVNADPRTLYYLKKYVDEVLSGSKRIYMTVPYNDGTKPGRRFVDISGRPHPIDAAEGGIIDGGGMFFESFQLFINDVTIINDPAVF